MKLWTEFKWTFGKLSLLEIASAELAEAERKKMEAHSGQEYAAALIVYEAARIKRLKATIHDLSKAKEQK
jgi:hypothetical protein